MSFTKYLVVVGVLFAFSGFARPEGKGAPDGPRPQPEDYITSREPSYSYSLKIDDSSMCPLINSKVQVQSFDGRLTRLNEALMADLYQLFDVRSSYVDLGKKKWSQEELDEKIKNYLEKVSE